LPTPVISLAEGGDFNIRIAPDAVELVSLLDDAFTGLYDQVGFDWKRLAGAKVVKVEGKNVYDYIDYQPPPKPKITLTTEFVPTAFSLAIVLLILTGPRGLASSPVDNSQTKITSP